MNSSIKVSVIVPVYNLEKYIEKCLLSIKNQILKEIEIIVIDDGSIDTTFSVINKLLKYDSRIKYIKQQNSGVSSARNSGLEIAKGEFITFVDGDDFIDEKMLYKMYWYGVENKLDIIFCALSGFLNSGYLDNSSYIVSSNKYIENMIDGKLPRTACGALFKSSLIKDNLIRFDEDMKYGEDMLFTIRVLSSYKKNVGVFSETYYFVEHRDGSSMRTVDPERFNKILLLSQRLNKVFSGEKRTQRFTKSINKYFFEDLNTSIFSIVKAKISVKEKIRKIKCVKKSEHTIKVLNYFVKDRQVTKYKIKAIYIKSSSAILVYLYYRIKSYFNK